jgi:hypothetical protein
MAEPKTGFRNRANVIRILLEDACVNADNVLAGWVQELPLPKNVRFEHAEPGTLGLLRAGSAETYDRQ